MYRFGDQWTEYARTIYIGLYARDCSIEIDSNLYEIRWKSLEITSTLSNSRQSLY